MAGPAKTKTGEYLNNMAKSGHFRQKLAEAALAVTEVYCKADDVSQSEMGSLLTEEVRTVLLEVYGWSVPASERAYKNLVDAFRGTTS